MNAVAQWEARGRYLAVDGHRMWVLDVPAATDAGRDPLLVLHGFPTCSFDWRHVLDALRAERRVVCPDLLGFGLSAKPDLRYSLRLQADLIETVAQQLGLSSVALVTHDIGNSVGGELLARSLEGALAFEVSQRVLTNGSIYMDLVQLSAGQELLLSLDDARLDDATAGLVSEQGFSAGVAGTFSPKTVVDPAEMRAQWQFASRSDGHRMMPRTIRYIEDRRKEERRYTGAIEAHPSPLGVVWGADDPIAVVAMTDALRAARADTPITILDGVGHYPMIEAPARFANATLQYL